ncbi:MAG: hypothetical protein Ct9H300mP6_08080 [Gammaproteobacteria bacterium]|nr:MAG: hypothetical protein Ct9H300mP6_08080 [Gammaproteobacteria bacterium]
MKERGEKTAAVGIANGVDPITFTLGASKVAKLGEDELDYAGGIRGKPVGMVQCETNNILVLPTQRLSWKVKFLSIRWRRRAVRRNVWIYGIEKK